MNIHIYADDVRINPESESVMVSMTGVDESQVLSEFSAQDKLQSCELSDVVSYLVEQQKEREDY